MPGSAGGVPGAEVGVGVGMTRASSQDSLGSGGSLQEADKVAMKEDFKVVHLINAPSYIPDQCTPHPLTL